MTRTPGPLPPALALLVAAWALPPAPAAGTPDDGGLSRVSRLQGSASLGRNREVVGATVLVRETAKASHVYVTASDASGRFRVDGLPDGDYRVEIRREGLEPVIKDDVGLRFPSRAVIEVTMEPSGSVSPSAPPPGGSPDDRPPVSVRGEIAERGGRPMPEVRLRFVRVDGSADPVVVASDEAGAFALPEMSPGIWRLETRAVGFLPIRAATDLAEDMRITVSMVPQPAGYEPSPLELMPQEQPVPPPPLVRADTTDAPPSVELEIETPAEGSTGDDAQ